MSKIYQPVILEHAEELVRSLTESNFFIDYEIDDTSFAFEYLCERFTEKFIENGIDLENGVFTEDEFSTILKEIVAGSVLKSLKDKGYVNSYEDDTTEEMFFLTDEGKEYLKEMMENPKDPEES
jgi:hypothetical protein